MQVMTLKIMKLTHYRFCSKVRSVFKKIAKPPILNSAKKEKRSFVGQKYLFFIFYID
jgi:hypothetical protein